MAALVMGNAQCQGRIRTAAMASSFFNIGRYRRVLLGFWSILTFGRAAAGWAAFGTLIGEGAAKLCVQLPSWPIWLSFGPTFTGGTMASRHSRAHGADGDRRQQHAGETC